MKIYLAKPGGEKRGPFTVEEINRDLAARIYRADAYWAWHEGLPEWRPLHTIPGIFVDPPGDSGPPTPPVPVTKPVRYRPMEYSSRGPGVVAPNTDSTATMLMVP